MKKIWKRGLSALLTIAMIATLLVVPAAAATGTNTADYYINFNDASNAKNTVTTDSGTTTFFTHTTSYKSSSPTVPNPAEITLDGVTYTFSAGSSGNYPLKLDSKGNIKFTNSGPGTLKIVAAKNPPKVDGTAATADASHSNVYTVEITEEKEHSVTNNGEVHVYYVSWTAKAVPLTGLTVTPATADVNIGDSLKLTATKQPDNTTDTTAITWTSDNSNVTVTDEGVVTVGAGATADSTATITATCGEQTASCTITVKAACEHDWQENITQEASCTEPGSKTMTCSKCSTSKTVEIEALGHQQPAEKTEVQAASCSALQIKAFICGRCSQEIPDTRENVADTYLNHEFENSICKNCKSVDEAATGVKVYDVDVKHASDENVPTTVTDGVWDLTTLTQNIKTNKGTITYGRSTKTKCVQLGSNEYFNVKAPSAGTLVMVLGNATGSLDMTVGSAATATQVTAADHVATLAVDAAADIKVERHASSSQNVYYMAFIPDASAAATYTAADATASDANGSITLDKTTGLAAGDTVTVTVTPEEHYQLATLKYNDGTTDTDITKSGENYTFTMPAANVTVTATFEFIPVNSISVTPATKTVTVGDTLHLVSDFTVTPDPANASDGVSWAVTAGNDVIKLEDTGITTLKAGTATLTATSEVDSNKTATVEITVQKKAAPTITVSVDHETVAAAGGNVAVTIAGVPTGTAAPTISVNPNTDVTIGAVTKSGNDYTATVTLPANTSTTDTVKYTVSAAWTDDNYETATITPVTVTVGKHGEAHLSAAKNAAGTTDTVTEGQSLVFAVTATATSSTGTTITPTYKWTLKDGDGTSLGTEATLTIANATVADHNGKTYVCTVTATEDGQSQTDTVEFTATVKAETKTVTFTVGEGATLTIKVDGTETTLNAGKLVDIAKNAVVTFTVAVDATHELVSVTGATEASGTYTVTADTVAVETKKKEVTPGPGGEPMWTLDYNVTETLGEGTTIAGGTVITSVDGIKLTYGGGASNPYTKYVAGTDTNEGKLVAESKMDALVKGKDAPTVGANNIPTGGTFYQFEATKNGTLTVAYGAFKKAAVITEQEAGATTATAVGGVGGTAPNDPGYINIGDEFEVKAGNTYYLYAASSKICLYGFSFVEKSATAPSVEIATPASNKLEEGQTLKLVATATEGAAVTWASDDEAVATVAADGTVTAKGAGTATITATATKNGETGTDAVTITVTEKVPEGTYVLNVSTDLTAGPTTNGQKAGTENYFTIHPKTDSSGNVKTVVEAGNKTFAEDGFKATQRLKTGDNYNTKDKLPGVEFTTSSAATVKIWWSPDTPTDSKPSEHRQFGLYKDGTGTAVATTNVQATVDTKGNGVVSTLNVTEAGTYFLGNDGTGGASIYKIEVVETNPVIKQKFDVTYELSFSEGTPAATAPAAVKVSEGGTVTLPTAPTVEGYTFDGWYVNDVKQGATITNVTANITVIGKYTKNGGSTETVDKTALNNAITAAEAVDASGVKVSDQNGADVLTTEKWIAKSVKDAFDKALADAKAVAADATQEQVNAAAKALTDATTALTDAITNAKNGTKTEGGEPKPPVVDKKALNDAVAAAQKAADATYVAEKDTDVYAGVTFVTAADKAEYQTAIDAAKAVADKTAATQDEVDDAVTKLAAATDKFEAAKKTGTKTASKDDLAAALDEAAEAKKGITTGANAASVTKGTKFVTAAEMKALNDAIAAAEAVMDDENATAADITKAAADLHQAALTFKSEIKEGTKTGGTSSGATSGRGEGASSTGTETKDDGTKVTTTVDRQGNTTVVAQKPDGSKITTVTKADGTVTIAAVNDKGETLADVKVPGTMPTNPQKFVDVPEGHWAEKAINDMAVLGMVRGVDDVNHIYDMESDITRGAVATILFRFSNGKMGMTSDFSDVAEGQWFTDAVAWASNVGVVTGYENGTFKPDGSITREQLAVMIARYAKLLGLDSAAGDLSAFTDGSAVQSWAKDGVAWCVAHGIINGRGDGTIDPGAFASRAEAAAMLDRFVELLK